MFNSFKWQEWEIDAVEHYQTMFFADMTRLLLKHKRTGALTTRVIKGRWSLDQVNGML